MKRPGLLTYARDIVTYVLGWTLILKQSGVFFAPPLHPNDMAIWIGAILIGVPGAANALSVLGTRFGTPSAPTPPPPPDSQASSSSSPTT